MYSAHITVLAPIIIFDSILFVRRLPMTTFLAFISCQFIIRSLHGPCCPQCVIISQNYTYKIWWWPPNWPWACNYLIFLFCGWLVCCCFSALFHRACLCVRATVARCSFRQLFAHFSHPRQCLSRFSMCMLCHGMSLTLLEAKWFNGISIVYA